MPLLDKAAAQELLVNARKAKPCRTCGHSSALDYCRSCDEFYQIHDKGCPLRLRQGMHYGHRLTIIPFVEQRGSYKP